MENKLTWPSTVCLIHMGHSRNKHTQLWASSCYCLLTTTVLTSDRSITILIGYIRSATTHTTTDVGQRLSSQRKWDMQLQSLCGNRDGGAYTAERQMEGNRMEETGRRGSWQDTVETVSNSRCFCYSSNLTATDTVCPIRIYGNMSKQYHYRADDVICVWCLM